MQGRSWMAALTLTSNALLGLILGLGLPVASRADDPKTLNFPPPWPPCRHGDSAVQGGARRADRRPRPGRLRRRGRPGKLRLPVPPDQPPHHTAGLFPRNEDPPERRPGHKRRPILYLLHHDPRARAAGDHGPPRIEARGHVVGPAGQRPVAQLLPQLSLQDGQDARDARTPLSPMDKAFARRRETHRSSCHGWNWSVSR